MSTRRRVLRPQRPETWGPWQDRSKALVHHRLNRERMVITAAYMNLVLSVQVSYEETSWGTVTHLWIHRHDDQPVTWAEMQRVKNELIGPERVGVEVYPPADQVIDVANMYHLWVLPAGFALPFSL